MSKHYTVTLSTQFLAAGAIGDSVNSYAIFEGDQVITGIKLRRRVHSMGIPHQVPIENGLARPKPLIKRH